MQELVELLRSIVEIMILWIVYYRVLLFFDGTRAFQVLKGILYLIVALVLSKVFEFTVLNWLLSNFFSIWIIVIVVIFAHEIRAGLARLGQQHLFNIALGEQEWQDLITELGDAVFKMARKKTGCLIAIEREMKLTMYIDSGIALDSRISSSLLQSIFLSTSPMHDGGVIIRNERIAASACLFPLSENPAVSKTVGTRHRAALGLSEHTDALVMLVSEETGDVAIAYDGKLTRLNDEKDFIEHLTMILNPTVKETV